jgi:hypothetical protein
MWLDHLQLDNLRLKSFDSRPRHELMCDPLPHLAASVPCMSVMDEFYNTRGFHRLSGAKHDIESYILVDVCKMLECCRKTSSKGVKRENGLLCSFYLAFARPTKSYLHAGNICIVLTQRVLQSLTIQDGRERDDL